MKNRPSCLLSRLLPRSSLALTSALALAACGSAPRPPASPATVEAHVAAAKAAAGTDLTALMGLCNPPPATRPPQEQVDRNVAALIAQPAPPPGQAFDNLYYVGGKWASAWALKTSDGIILIDALNNAAEAAALIEPGLRKFGLDPAQIKIVIVTHGHGDHYGGADYLIGRYRPRIVMSEADWRMTETKLEFATPVWGPAPKRVPGRDLAVNDGDRVTLGDTTVTLYQTPGHTMGTLTPVFEVRSGSRVHRALVWGGTAFNFGKDLPRLDAYVAATERMRTLAERQGMDVMLSNHPGYDGSIAKFETLAKAGGGGAHPFVLGTPAVARALTVMGQCAQATRDRFALQP